MVSTFICIVARITNFIPFCYQITCHCMDITTLYLFLSWWVLGLFPIFAVINSAALNICAYVFVWTYVFSFLGCIIFIKLLSLMVTFIFHLLRNYQEVFQCCCAILHFRQQRISVPVTPHPHQYLLFFVFAIVPFFS